MRRIGAGRRAKHRQRARGRSLAGGWLAFQMLAGAGAAAAWSPDTHLAIAEQAAAISPADLRRQIERHERRFQSGVLERFHSRRAIADLQRTLADEIAASVADIREHRPFADIVFRMGRITHLIAAANYPLLTMPPGADRSADYVRYVDAARPRFTVVFYGRGRALERPADVPRLVERSLLRSRLFSPSIAEEYRRVGAVRGVELFDDRSTAFGVASLAFSHAVSDAAAVLRYIWLRAGGADPRPLRLTPPAAVSR